MKLLIKNMVCPRCISAVKDILESEGLTVNSISLGDAEIEEDLTDEQRLSIEKKLHDIGFELLDDPRSVGGTDTHCRAAMGKNACGAS